MIRTDSARAPLHEKGGIIPVDFVPDGKIVAVTAGDKR